MAYVLVLGGVRSGKSRLAVELAERSAAAVTFVATAQAGDAEMAGRIAAHRAERPGEWQTVEASRDLAVAVAAIEPARFVIVDCLTVWVANRMLAGDEPAVILAESRRLADLLAARRGDAVVVSNEVGMGVHPSSELGRHYRDVLGTVNTTVAATARHAALVVAGRVLPLAATDRIDWFGR